MKMMIFSLVILALSMGTDPEPSPLKGVNWLAGGWSLKKGEVEMEEVWLAPKGGMMLGLHRDVLGKDRVFFEYLRIEVDGEGLVYHASPLGRKATSFKLKSLDEDKVVFENMEHDYPQRIIYLKKDADTLVARIEGLKAGEMKSSQWEWKRTDPF